MLSEVRRRLIPVARPPTPRMATGALYASSFAKEGESRAPPDQKGDGAAAITAAVVGVGESKFGVREREAPKPGDDDRGKLGEVVRRRMMPTVLVMSFSGCAIVSSIWRAPRPDPGLGGVAKDAAVAEGEPARKGLPETVRAALNALVRESDDDVPVLVRDARTADGCWKSSEGVRLRDEALPLLPIGRKVQCSGR